MNGIDPRNIDDRLLTVVDGNDLALADNKGVLLLSDGKSTYEV